MNKIALSIATLAAVAGFAFPALANFSDFDKFSLLSNLDQQGIHAVDATDNGDGTVSVTVQQANGNQTFVTYDLNAQQIVSTRGLADRNS
jgi:hypothetical protein